MAIRSVQSSEDEETEINLSPMIDCIFILLIFFIVTTVFVEDPGVEIVRPYAAGKEKLEKNSIIVAVTADGKVVYGGKEMSITNVGARVRQILSRDDYPVIIKGDAKADHGVISKVWSEMKIAGAKKISPAVNK